MGFGVIRHNGGRDVLRTGLDTCLIKIEIEKFCRIDFSTLELGENPSRKRMFCQTFPILNYLDISGSFDTCIMTHSLLLRRNRFDLLSSRESL